MQCLDCDILKCLSSFKMLLVFIMANLLNMLYFLNGVIGTNIDDLDYTRLQFLGVSCHPKDTCDSGIPLEFYNRTCQCDFSCQFYGDCCIDAKTSGSRRMFQRGIQGVQCLSHDFGSKGSFVIGKCHKNYKGSADIRESCESGQDLSDPLAAAPVTDVVLNITFKNRYCAECNHASPLDLRSWGVTIQCSDIPDNTSKPIVDSNYVQEHLTYVETEEYSNQWGFFYKSEDSSDPEDQFYPCNIPFVLPDGLTEHVRKCVPNLVSTCAPSWRRNVHHDLCQAYMAIVYADNKVYRNPDCAYCNMKSLEKLKCIIPEMTVIGRRKKPALQFTLLLDVNMSDGNRVGEVRDNRCPEGQRWDPFFKKCRMLLCAIPGYRMRNGRCVKP